MSRHITKAGRVWPTISIAWTGQPEEAEVHEVVDRFVGYGIELSEDGDYTPTPIPRLIRGGLGGDCADVICSVMGIELDRS